MPPDIELVPSPRPKPGQEPPLPTYHELLSTLCDEFQVPGSPTFSEAIRYIKEHYPKTTKKFLDWYLSQHATPIPIHMELIAQRSITGEGRHAIAQSYVGPASHRIQHLVTHQGSIRDTRRQARLIESLIESFPERERFIDPLMTLRESLIELYSFMSPNYEQADPEFESDGELTYERIQQVAGEQEAEYTGPRPTRFEHLFDED